MRTRALSSNAYRRFFASSIAIIVLGMCSCKLTSYYVPKVQIDGQKHIIPTGYKRLFCPETQSTYFFFHTATGLTLINHLIRKERSDNWRSLLYLEESNGRLERTVKDNELLIEDFGALITQKTCFYNRPFDAFQSSIKVLVQNVHTDVGRAIPDSVYIAPSDLPPFTSIAIVHAFHLGQETIYGIGNYEANGVLGNIVYGGNKNGTFHADSDGLRRNPWSFEDARKKYGLPNQIDIDQYIHTKFLPNQITASRESVFVVLIYNFGQFIQVDTLTDGAVVSSRMLKPVVADEESILGAECDTHLRKQEQEKQPTNW